MGVSSGGQGGVPPTWIFVHGTNLVNKGIVLFFGFFLLFFGLFFLAPHPPKKGIIVLLFSLFYYFGVFVFVAIPPGNFSADALVSIYKYSHHNKINK